MKLIFMTNENCSWESSCLLPDDSEFTQEYQEVLVKSLREKSPADMLTATIVEGLMDDEI